MEKVLAIVREKNTGVRKVTGETFGELIKHFIIGSDETKCIPNADGGMKIIGKFRRKKHKQNCSNCLASCTI